MLLGYPFNYGGTNNAFTPAPVARTEASSSADCLSGYAQIAVDAWFMGDVTLLTNVTAATSTINNFADCVGDCSGDANCAFITFDYVHSICYKKAYIKTAG